MARKTAVKPMFECLEPRLLLSGNVTAQVADGCLTVSGNPLGNSIRIDQADLAADQLRLTPRGDTTVNGGAEPLVLTGVTADVRIDLDGGDDVLDVARVKLPGKLIFLGGSGDEKITLSGVDVQGDVRVDNGGGDSDITVYASAIAGGLAVAGAGGEESFRLWLSEVDGNVEISGGSGDLYGAVYDSTVGGALNAGSQGDAGSFHVSRSTVAGVVSIEIATGQWHGSGIAGHQIDIPDIDCSIFYTDGSTISSWTAFPDGEILVLDCKCRYLGTVFASAGVSFDLASGGSGTFGYNCWAATGAAAAVADGCWRPGTDPAASVVRGADYLATGTHPAANVVKGADYLTNGRDAAPSHFGSPRIQDAGEAAETSPDVGAAPEAGAAAGTPFAAAAPADGRQADGEAGQEQFAGPPSASHIAATDNDWAELDANLAGLLEIVV